MSILKSKINFIVHGADVQIHKKYSTSLSAVRNCRNAIKTIILLQVNFTVKSVIKFDFCVCCTFDSVAGVSQLQFSLSLPIVSRTNLASLCGLPCLHFL